jgi:hypothetical protein
MTQSDIQKALSSIFNVDVKYIVPKQGNWFNPQFMLPTALKPLTWVAYLIKTTKSDVFPYYYADEGINSAETVNISKIDLQIVGTRAEELSQSLALWHLRGDVEQAFDLLNAKLMTSDYNIITSDFHQDGMNTILAYNVSFKLVWINSIATTQQILTQIDESGTIIT